MSSFSESLSHWNGEIEDLDTEQLANALSAPSVDDIKEEKQHRGSSRYIDIRGSAKKG